MKEWLFTSERYDAEIDSNARNDLQYGMSCTKEPWLIQRFLNDQLNVTKVRAQDTLLGIRVAARSAYANSYAWYFSKSNWNELFTRFAQFLLLLFPGCFLKDSKINLFVL